MNKKILAFGFLLFAFVLNGFAQETPRMYIFSKDGTQMYLLHNPKKKNFYMFNSIDPVGRLIETKGREGTPFDMEYTVYFSGQPNVTYVLTIKNGNREESRLIWKNTDGSSQTYHSILYTNGYVTENANNPEIIFSIGPPIIFAYFSANYPNGVLLNVVGGGEGGSYTVAFPNSANQYILKESQEEVTVKNPNGTLQRFKPMK